MFFFFVSCNFIHNEKNEIEHPYYIIATDSKSQATISLFLEEYDSYLGISQEGITEYAVMGDYIFGKREMTREGISKVEYEVILKGSDKSSRYKIEEFLSFLKKKKLDSKKIEWKKV